LHTVLLSYAPPLKWNIVAQSDLPTQPYATVADFSVVGTGSKQGVYFFGPDYQLMRYPLHYTSDAEVATTFLGFFGYTAPQLYGLPQEQGRFDLTQFGQFVSSTISVTPSPTFLKGLQRDYVFFFDDHHNPSGQAPVQIALPEPTLGYFRVVDVAANWATEVEDAKVFWIQVDDPLEPTPPDPEITLIMGQYKYAFTGNPFSGDIDYISGSLVPAGGGDGKVDLNCVERLAIDGEPQGVYGSTDLIAWFLETSPPALECFSIVSSDSSGELNQHLCTVHSFYQMPRDICCFPAHKGGYDAYNWVIVLEEGTGQWSIESFNQKGQKKVGLKDVPGYPANLDVDPVNYEVHVWFSLEVGGPLYAVVLKLSMG